MARYNIYGSRLSEYQRYQRNDDARAESKMLAQMAKQLNQRFYRLEKSGMSEDSAYFYAQKETGMVKPRYSQTAAVYERMSAEDRYEMMQQINAKLQSKTSTISGLRDVYENRLTGSIESLNKLIDESRRLDDPDYQGKTDIDKASFDYFLRNGGGEMMNSKYLDSEQVVRDWLDTIKSGGSVDKFLDKYQKQKARYLRDHGTEAGFRPDYAKIRKAGMKRVR